MVSKLILVFIGVIQLLAGTWAGFSVFEDTAAPASALGMMGMLGSLFHTAVLFAAVSFRVRERKIVTLLLLVWHVPEAVLIAAFGMGVPEEQRLVGIALHATLGVLALLSWHLAKRELV